MRTLIATLTALVLLIPAASMAQNCYLLRQADDLELTDQQIEQIRQNSLAERKEMIQLRADLQTAKLEMRELMIADKLDKARVLKKNDEISDLKAKMAKKRLEARLNRLSILTDEQRANYRQNNMQRPFKGRNDRFNRWFDHRRGPDKDGRGRRSGSGIGDCPYFPDGYQGRQGGGRFGYFDNTDDGVTEEDVIVDDEDYADFYDF